MAASAAASSIISPERFGGNGRQAAEIKPIRLKDIPYEDYPRIDLNDKELNRVLGGGLVPGSLILLGGEPGIGKSHAHATDDSQSAGIQDIVRERRGKRAPAEDACAASGKHGEPWRR